MRKHSANVNPRRQARAGADGDALTDYGATPLYFATLALDPKCVEVLLRHGAASNVGGAKSALALSARLARSPASDLICAHFARSAEWWSAHETEDEKKSEMSDDMRFALSQAALHAERLLVQRAATLDADPTRRLLVDLLAEGDFVRDQAVRRAVGSVDEYTHALALLCEWQRKGVLICVLRSLAPERDGASSGGGAVGEKTSGSDGAVEVEYINDSAATRDRILELNVAHVCATLKLIGGSLEKSVRERLLKFRSASEGAAAAAAVNAFHISAGLSAV
jgi:hypothetical protein